MANKNLFKNVGKPAPAADTTNVAGGPAYSRNAEETIAQLACTGCLNNTYYSTAETQLDEVIKAALNCSPTFLAKTAVYAREKGFMKDMPAVLMAVLSIKDITLFKQTYPKVIDNAKMLRNLVQIIRSGKVGRSSFGRAVKNMIARQLNDMPDKVLLNATVGNDPSLMDVIRLIHPKPKDKAREAFYGYILGRLNQVVKGKPTLTLEMLPPIVQQFELWKKNPEASIPPVDFQLITGTPGITKDTWQQLAEQGNWHFTRMNLNTFARHGLFEQTVLGKKLGKENALIETIVKKLTDREQITKARVFPYQLYAAATFTTDVPKAIQNALQDAMDISVANIPSFPGNTAVFIDGSGSMSSAITGNKEGATSKISCVQAASLIGAGIMKNNPNNTDLFIFDTSITLDSTKDSKVLNPRDSLLTLTNNIESKAHGGGTNISLCMDHIVKNGTKHYQNVIIISDNCSWADFYPTYGRATQTAAKWVQYNKNKKSKLVLIDLQPYTTTQVSSASDVLNVGGFSNAIFDVISAFLNTSSSWIDVINNTQI